MRVWNSIRDWMEFRRGLSGGPIGFVPTMGALHCGHASLVERCRTENEIVAVSIFVNPSQFNQAQDLERYPRTMDQDLALLKRLKVDHVLAPCVEDLYPNGYQFRIESDTFTRELEGAYRPGFLQGVMTIVMKLLNVVRADRAYFGEKDFQQLRAVAAMTGDFFLPTEIIACPTIREASGLAESSRNALLSASGRAKAACLYRALSDSRDCSEAKLRLEAEGFRVEYIEEHWGRRFGAAWLEGVRLIDNISLEIGGQR